MAQASNPYGLYQAPGYTPGYVTGAADNPATARPVSGMNSLSTTIPQAVQAYAAPPQPQANPYGLYQAPGYVQGQVTQGQPVYSAPQVQAPVQNQPRYPSPVEMQAQQDIQGVAPGATPQVITANRGLADIWKQMTNPANPNDALAFRNWAAENGYSNLSSTPEVAQTFTRTAPVRGDPGQVIANNRGLYDIWVSQARPANTEDMNAFGQWAAQNGYPQLAGESTQEQFAAFKSAKKSGTLAPVAPVTTPTFQSTGAVKIPTGTVTPTQTGYTAPRTTVTTAPSRPGYVAPTGRVYTNWTPKRKVT